MSTKLACAHFCKHSRIRRVRRDLKFEFCKDVNLRNGEDD